MSKTPISTVRDLIADHEGCCLTMYRCPADRLTVGYGHNIEDNGISQATAEFILDEDIRKAQAIVSFSFPWFAKLSEPRKAAVIDLRFNLGNRLNQFVKFIAAMARQDYEAATDELTDSLWFKQVGRRGIRISEMIRFGAWPT
jgi:lysozyme